MTSLTMERLMGLKDISLAMRVRLEEVELSWIGGSSSLMS